MPQPEQKSNEIKALHWLPDNRIQFEMAAPPKKITGTKVAKVLDEDPFSSPFSVWSEITRLYEPPFKETKFTRAGEAIEPKQFAYAKEKLAKPGREFISPTDRYGDNPLDATRGDFFDLVNVFGGMWDFVYAENGRITGLLEMKTTNARNYNRWTQQIPKEKIMQAALYAWLLDAEDYYIVASFLPDHMYDHPEDFKCNENNTIIMQYNMRRQKEKMTQRLIEPAMKWWDAHISQTISPTFDRVRDVASLNAIIEKYGAISEGHMPSLIKCTQCGSTDLDYFKGKLKCNHCGCIFTNPD